MSDHAELNRLSRSYLVADKQLDLFVRLTRNAPTPEAAGHYAAQASMKRNELLEINTDIRTLAKRINGDV